MHHLKRLLTSIIVAVLILTLVAPTAAVFAHGAAAQSAVTATTTVNLRLRSGPGTGYSQVGSVPAGTQLQVLGRDEASNWLYVEHDGTRGWLAGWFVRITGELS